MNNIKYVSMDVHKSITVIVALNELGQFESRSQIKTKGENICDFFRGISGKVEVVFEEGTHSAWLYKLLKPLVASVTVCDPRHNKLIEDWNKSRDRKKTGEMRIGPPISVTDRSQITNLPVDTQILKGRRTWRNLPSIFLIVHNFDYLPHFFSVSMPERRAH
jgi:hypothetical protein